MDDGGRRGGKNSFLWLSHLAGIAVVDAAALWTALGVQNMHILTEYSIVLGSDGVQGLWCKGGG